MRNSYKKFLPEPQHLLRSGAGERVSLLFAGALVFAHACSGDPDPDPTPDGAPDDGPDGDVVDAGPGPDAAPPPDADVLPDTPPKGLAAYSDGMQIHVSWEEPDRVNLLYSTDPECDWESHGDCENAGSLEGLEGGDATIDLVSEDLAADEVWHLAAVTGGGVSEPALGAVAHHPVGIVDAMAARDDRVYLLGQTLSRLAPITGGAARFNAEGARLRDPLPEVEGEVRAIAPDGAGGWILGGDFDAVAGAERDNLARLRPDDTLDPAWRARTDGAVRALAVVGGAVYAGGGFGRAGDESHGDDLVELEALAAFDATSGELDEAWDAGLDDAVRALAEDGDDLLVGGEFETAGGGADEHRGLVRIEAASGAPDGAWDPEIEEAGVRDLHIHGDHVYVAGDFEGIGDDHADDLAVVDRQVGSVDTSFQPDVSGPVRAVARAENTVYAGRGDNGELVALHASDGSRDDARSLELDLLDFVVTGTANVNALTAAGDAVYAGGNFNRVAGERRDHLVAIDVDSGEVSDWDAGAGAAVHAVALEEGNVLVGGEFFRAGGTAHERLAALDADTGRSDASWQPDIAESPLADNAYLVESLAVSDELVFVGGADPDQNSISTQHRAFDRETGQVSPEWEAVTLSGNRFIASSIRSMRYDDGVVYVGGNFESIGPSGGAQPIEGMAALDADDASLVWGSGAADTDGLVTATSLSEDAFYFGGSGFNEAGGKTRLSAAAVARSDGSLLDWAPDADDGLVDALAASPDGARAYLGGNFGGVTGADEQENFAIVDADAGEAEQSGPEVDDPVSALAAGEGVVFAGGDFRAVGDADRDHVAAIDPESASAVESWDPGANGQVTEIVPVGERLFVLGAFTRVGGGSGEDAGDKDARRRALVILDAESGDLAW